MWLRRLAVAGVAGVGALIAADAVINDEVDDWTEPAKRFFSPPPKPEGPKKKVVVLGSGWGALSFIRKVDPELCDITVISPRPYFFYTPLLAGSATGTVSFRNILEPIRNFCTRTGRAGVQYVKAEVSEVDLAKQSVSCVIPGGGASLSVPYDELVVAVGVQPNTFGIKGVETHALFLKELEHAQMVQRRVLACLEHANALFLAGAPPASVDKLLHFVVVGGGPTGVELCGELSDFVSDDVSERFPAIAGRVKITLVEVLPRLLNMFEPQLSEYAMSNLRERGVDVKLQMGVCEVGQDYANIKPTAKDAPKNAKPTRLDTAMVVWVAGVAPRPLTRALQAQIGPEIQNDRRGLKVDGQLRVQGAPHVWALGDCAFTGAPPTAQVAQQAGKYLGRLFRDVVLPKGGAPEPIGAAAPFKYDHKGALAYVGAAKAVAQVTNPFGKSKSQDHAVWRTLYGQWAPDDEVKVSGVSAFAFWRSVYFSKLLSSRNRSSVAYDWWRTAQYGRDITTAPQSSIKSRSSIVSMDDTLRK